MCRFVFYSGRSIRLASLLTEPEHGLIAQSTHARERDEPLNGDGFGVAWYGPDANEPPAQFRSITPAWSNRNLHELARVVTSSCILAHVRAATQQLEVSESNCHPFRYGRYAFMHNGDIGGFKKLRRPLINELSDDAFNLIRGSTDSEHLFALIIDSMLRQTGSTLSLADILRQGIQRALDLVKKYAPGEYCYINAVFTDGRSSAICRFTTDEPNEADSLYLNQGRRYTCTEGVCRMLEPGDQTAAAIVSSEPLSDESGWTAIPVNHLIRLEGSRVSEPELLLAP